MPRRPRVDRPIEKRINLPESLAAQVDLILYSELEGRVPYGAWAEYIKALVEADLLRRQQRSATHG